MTINLSTSHFDNENIRLYCATDNNDRYIFIDEWQEDKRVLYTCTLKGLPCIPLHDATYEIGCSFNHT